MMLTRIGGASALRGVVARRQGAVAIANGSHALPRATAAIHSSSRRSDAAHGSTSAHAEEHDEHYPSEGFSAPIWRYTFLTLIGSAALIRWNSTRESAAHHGEDGDDEHDDDASKPFLTRYISYHMPDASQWIANNDDRIDSIRQRTEDFVFIQDAERSPVLRKRYYGGLHAASPSKLAVGEDVDLLYVKKAEPESESEPESSEE